MALEAVQAQAGHASIESTRIYLHLADDWLASQYRRAAEAIDAQLLSPASRSSPSRLRRVEVGGERAAAAARPGHELGRRDPEMVAHDAPLPGADRPASCARAASTAPTWRCAPSPRSSSSTHPRSPASPQVTRRHIEDFKPWLAKRPGQNRPGSPPPRWRTGSAPCGCSSSGSSEWGWDEAPTRVPMFPGDLPRQDHPLPKALDDAAAAKLLRAAQADKRLLVRVTVEVLLRTGLRVSEFTALRSTRSCRSAPRPGCTSRSANSARTATCRCTRSWSP